MLKLDTDSAAYCEAVTGTYRIVKYDVLLAQSNCPSFASSGVTVLTV
jgi:hypothetical protein